MGINSCIYKAGANSIPLQARNSSNIPCDPSRISTRDQKPNYQTSYFSTQGWKEIVVDERAF
jgi:hypothetical protein